MTRATEIVYACSVQRAQLRPPEGGRCDVCGGPLGSDVWYVTTLPNGIHEHCRDWSEQPFPYARDVEGLRRLHARLRITLRVVEETGRWLAQAQRRWPHGAQETVNEGREMLASLAERLGKLGLARWKTRR